MLKAGKKSRIACNTGVIYVIEIFTELPCSSSSSSSSASSSSSSSASSSSSSASSSSG